MPAPTNFPNIPPKHTPHVSEEKQNARRTEAIKIIIREQIIIPLSARVNRILKLTPED